MASETLSADREARIEALLAQMTLEEKVALLAGASSFGLNGVPRLGVPAIEMSDGPTGVRSIRNEPATVFPVGVAVASTWNPDLAQEVAAAIGREAKAMGVQVILAPTVNMMRIPHWGRNFETYSEDPYLAGRIGAGFVKGLQGEGVGASLKHYAANNQELHRFEVSAEMDERTLREIYLAAFEMIVAEANPWTVMASYNRLEGTYASEHPRLLNEILKTEWGYDGVVVSDWGAVHSTAAPVNAGLDLEMPGPPRWFGEKLVDAARSGEADMGAIEDAARRMLRLILRTAPPDVEGGDGELRSERHRAIARRAAEEAMVLLKNDEGILPLDRAVIRKLAVIGPNADVARIQGGGSSRVTPGGRQTPLSAIRQLLGDTVEVVYAQGVDSEPTPRQAQARDFSPNDPRDQPGLLAEYFKTADFSGEPDRVEVETAIWKRFSGNVALAEGPDFAAIRWTGVFWPQRSGAHEFSIRGAGAGRLVLDGEMLIEPSTPVVMDNEDLSGQARPRRTVPATLQAGRGYPIRIEYIRSPDVNEFVSVGVRHPAGSIEEAVALALDADAVILVLGSASATEGEGYDRADLALTGAQDQLAAAVLAANQRTVVVLNTGSPFTLPWADDAKALLQTWLPGEAGPEALARVLFGESAPSGRLPVTFPRRMEDTPAFPHYRDDLRGDYGEGLFMGYRHYDRANIAPLFAFGHGLTYTRFSYVDIAAPAKASADDAVAVAVRLINAGSRDGAETVQLYVRPISPRVTRPVKELKAFQKVEAAPGESATATLVLTPRAFAFYDPDQSSWVTEPGDYELLVGASVEDIRLRAPITLV